MSNQESKFLRVVEHIEPFGDDEAAANASALDVLTQVGCLGSQVLRSTQPDVSKFRLQAFFDADGVTDSDWLPDGSHVRLAPRSLIRTL